MVDLTVTVEKAEAVRMAIAPTLSFQLRLVNTNRQTAIQSIMLRCQIRIEPSRRKYDSQEQSRLFDLFGSPSGWGQSLRPMLWTHAQTIVPAFADEVMVDLPVPCTHDFNIAASRYFDGLENGEVPLCLLFSGTVFAESEAGLLCAVPISWNLEAAYRLPVRIWKDMMEIYYPNTVWLPLRRDNFERLSQFKRAQGLASWEQAVEMLLSGQAEGVSL